MQDYSQNNEQAVILKYFGDFRGTFLDVGANNGVVLSNTRALYELSWRGVLVEPSPAAFTQLKKEYGVLLDDSNHDEIIFGGVNGVEMWWLVNSALTVADGPIDLYDSGTHLNKGDVALLSTTVPKEMDRWKKSGETFTKTTVRGITFDTLMKETGVSKFDFISIDCEGADWDVLKQIDLTAVGCRLLCVEVNNSADSHFTQYVAKYGLRLLHRNYENRIYSK